mmetsp:Transcript_49471/g.143487  ORF Transcript_49471/g.143487 Transcript_49471/m.143487 type:complete len:333 (-) Transcript_49471:361-1359(-)
MQRRASLARGRLRLLEEVLGERAVRARGLRGLAEESPRGARQEAVPPLLRRHARVRLRASRRRTLEPCQRRREVRTLARSRGLVAPLQHMRLATLHAEVEPVLAEEAAVVLSLEARVRQADREAVVQEWGYLLLERPLAKGPHGIMPACGVRKHVIETCVAHVHLQRVHRSPILIARPIVGQHEVLQDELLLPLVHVCEGPAVHVHMELRCLWRVLVQARMDVGPRVCEPIPVVAVGDVGHATAVGNPHGALRLACAARVAMATLVTAAHPVEKRSPAQTMADERRLNLQVKQLVATEGNDFVPLADDDARLHSIGHRAVPLSREPHPRVHS